jgi:plasmid stabilization system protein ParE
MTFGFNEDALQEYRDAARWYSEQRGDLGLEFTEAVDAHIRQILADPGRFQTSGDGFHVFRMKRFPYYMHYRFSPQRTHVRILAFLHNRRRPGYWRERN